MTISMQHILSSTPNFKFVSGTYQKLNLAMQSPDTSNAQIVEILKSDGAIHQQLMTVINSSHIPFPTLIDNLTAAVNIVGTSQIRDLVLAISIIKLSHQLPASNDIDIQQFWQQSIACGLTARVIATFRREFNLESYFIAGLLHNIGQLFLSTSAPDDYRQCQQIAIETKTAQHEVELAHFGFNHATLGARLLEQWLLPPHLQEIAEFHHQPEKAVEYPPLVALISFADAMTYNIGYGQQYNCLSNAIDPLYIEQWGVSEKNHAAIEHQTKALMPNTVSAFLKL